MTSANLPYPERPIAPPRIVVLDSEKFSDLSWDLLRALGHVTLFERTTEHQVVLRASDAGVVLTNKSPITARTIGQLPNLRYIGVLATGHDIVDCAAARIRSIPVSNVPEYGTNAVAQHTFALLLELTQSTGAYTSGVRDGCWTRGKADWSYWNTPVLELAGLKLGLVGSGKIAQAVAHIGKAIGMHVSFADRRGGPDRLHDVLAQSDVVSLHCPLTCETRHLIRAETILKMKQGALLLNTSRGPLIQEDDLAVALNSGYLGGAGLDVLSVEPPQADHPLFTAKNCLITPHMAWAATSARARLLSTAIANVQAFLHGAARNVVN